MAWAGEDGAETPTCAPKTTTWIGFSSSSILVLGEEDFRDATKQLRDIEFWGKNRLWAEVFESPLNYRPSKFQPLMPPWVAQEVVAVEGAWQRLARVSEGGVDDSHSEEG